MVLTELVPGEWHPVPQGEALYSLGNGIRGYKTGYFSSDDEAWRVLSDQFNQSFPSRSGRTVHLTKTIAAGLTAGGNETESDRELRLECERLLQEDRERA